MKRVLLLGAGLVSPPFVRYFLLKPNIRLTVASAEFSRVAPLVEGHGDRVRLLRSDVGDPATLDALLEEADVAVSLLPASMLSSVIRSAIRARVPVVSTSYHPPEYEELDDAARAAGILVLNEVGFDPGIDHMAAMRTLRRIRLAGGIVDNYMSAAGGFPAHDANNNPWGYKFSWSPRAVILAGRNPARFLRDGEEIRIAGEDLFQHRWAYEIEGKGVYEIYPNRDSLVYRNRYGLVASSGFFRGTIRYPGWCATMSAAAKLGLFCDEQEEWRSGTTYGDVLRRKLPGANGSIIERLAAFLDVEQDSPVITRLEWAGFLSDRPLEVKNASPLDIFVSRLTRLMRYRPGERDMAVLQHHFTAKFPDGHRERIEGSLIGYGDPWSDTAMSRSVSLPAAIAARMIAEGRVEAEGLAIPIAPEIFEPILAELEEFGVHFTDRTISSFPGPLD
jgi:saccharopine dehydrogenase (NADP+, L-glutamate forming)